MDYFVYELFIRLIWSHSSDFRILLVVWFWVRMRYLHINGKFYWVVILVLFEFKT